MNLGMRVGGIVKQIDKRFGLVALLTGDPRPPRGGFDLDGEKLMDWGWICANLPAGPKQALEIGPGKSPIISAMLSLGYEVTAVDTSADPTSIVKGFQFVRGDFNELSFEGCFDVIVICSVIEHVGIAGRYDCHSDENGDLKAMRRVRALLQPGGQLLLTIPVGQDAVHKPWHRVYGRERLPKLLDGFTVLRSRFLQKTPNGPWFGTTEARALETPIDIRRYALGEMVLQLA